MGNLAEILHAASQFTYFDLIDPAYDPPLAYTIFARGKREGWRLAARVLPWVHSYTGVFRLAINVLLVLITVGNIQSLSLSVSLFMLGHVETCFQSRESLTPLPAALNEPWGYHEISFAKFSMLVRIFSLSFLLRLIGRINRFPRETTAPGYHFSWTL